MNLKGVVANILPHGVVNAVQRRNAARRRRLQLAESAPGAQTFSYEAALDVLARRGVPPLHASGGSIPPESLAACARLISERFGRAGRPVLGLHIGNFVGVSLAYVTHAVRALHPDSCVFSIDPNIPHRSVRTPQDHALALLNAFGLQRNAAILVGYSLEKAIGNDGVIYDDGYDPVQAFAGEMACEAQLGNLGKIAAGRFDFAMIDGNHDAAYLSREIAAIGALLKPGGLLFLDDVSSWWEEIIGLVARLESEGWVRSAYDGRVAALEMGQGAIT